MDEKLFNYKIKESSETEGLPNNLAKIDKEGEEGNAYTKTQVDAKVSAVDKKITTEINKISVGGTNLLRSTRDFSLNEATTEALYTEPNYRGLKVLSKTKNQQNETSGGSLDVYIQSFGNHISSEFITISFYAKTTAGQEETTDVRCILLNADIRTHAVSDSALSYAAILTVDGKKALWDSQQPRIKITSEWKRYSLTLRVTDSKMLQTMRSNWKVGIKQLTKGNTLHLCGVKVEYGKFATDWTPSPEDKLDNPTTTLSEPNLEYKYVPILNEQGNAKKMLAGDLGKNISNSNMKVPEGTERTLDLTGARLRTSGLEDKTNDMSFGKTLVMDERGVWGTAPYIKYQYNSSTITINNVVPQNLAPRPTFTEDIERILKDYRTYQFEDIDLSTFTQEGNMMISPFAINSESDFIIEIQGVIASATGEEIGLGRGNITEYSAMMRITGGYWWYLKGSEHTYSNALNTDVLTSLIIIKTGGVITIGRLLLNRIDYTSFNANAELGDYKIIYSPSLKIGKIKVKRL